MGWDCDTANAVVLTKPYTKVSTSAMQIAANHGTVKGVKDLLIEELKKILKNASTQGPQ
jgi:hypothetical protein